MREYIRRNGDPITCSRGQFVMRQMPYGTYYCADGREVLFDRDYAPICERYPGQPAKMASSAEWVPKVRQEWIYEDRTPAYKKPKIAKAKLEEWGMFKPVMAEIEEA